MTIEQERDIAVLALEEMRDVDTYMHPSHEARCGAMRGVLHRALAAIKREQALQALSDEGQNLDMGCGKPSTLGQQVAAAQAEMAKWTPEQRASVRLEGGDHVEQASEAAMMDAILYGTGVTRGGKHVPYADLFEQASTVAQDEREAWPNDPIFDEWWNADRLTQTNPYAADTPAFWAWEGWQARGSVAQPVGTFCRDCGKRNLGIHTCSPQYAEQPVGEAAPLCTGVPFGWRDTIEHIRDHICAGGFAENAQHERSVVEPYLDSVIDALVELEKSQPVAHPVSEAVAYRAEMKPGDYCFMRAKHYEYNKSMYVGSRVHALNLGRLVHEPDMDEDVMHLFPSIIEDKIAAAPPVAQDQDASLLKQAKGALLAVLAANRITHKRNQPETIAQAENKLTTIQRAVVMAESAIAAIDAAMLAEGKK